MTDKRQIDIGDGRIVEMTEVGDGPPDLTPVVKPRHKNPGQNAGKRKKTKHQATFKDSPRGVHKLGKSAWTEKMKIPGYREWLIGRRRVVEKLFLTKPKCRKGVPDGMRREEAEQMWVIAKKKAKEDMAKLEKAGLIDPTDEHAREAMQSTLEVMRSPMNQQIRLQAARQVLEWTRAKPATKTEMTVNAAEAWLASLAEEPKED
jgi:hypothetical protein